MLHYTVDPEDFRACSCWYAEARAFLASVPRGAVIATYIAGGARAT